MNLELLKRTMIFKNMNEDEIKIALKQLHSKEKEYKKNETILHAGDTTSFMGLVLQGSVTIENNDSWGNRTILSHVGVGQFFAETYALLKNEPLQVDVVASVDCIILFLRIDHLDSMEPWTMKFTRNLLMISAHKNLTLSNRSFHTAPKTIRARVMAYLHSISLKNHTNEFDIPFDRQELADYLNLERSALSKELGKMKRDGLIEFRKNHFIIQ